MSGDGATHLIYVHGLWMNGTESLFLRRRLQKQLGIPVHAFRYRSVSATIADAVAGLQQFVRDLAPKSLHLVAHSLGGLVIYRTLEHVTGLPPGRVVFLGTPAVASRAAIGG